MVHTSGSDIGFFHIGSENGTAAGFKTDAKRFTASYDKFDVLNKIYFEGTSISGNGLSFTADQSVRGTIALTNSGIDAEIKSARGCTIKVLLSGKPSIVQSNGLTISDWTYDELSKMLTLKIAGGTVPLIIKK
jgi:hypothetical protein